VRRFVVALWIAFVLQGAFHAIVAPMWDGFDEPGHLAYILFIDDHGRPPGFDEPSFAQFFLDANRQLPSTVGLGAPTFVEWRNMPPAERERNRAILDQLSRDPNRYRVYMSGNYERQQGPVFYYLAAIPGFVLRHLTLPKLVVAMRLFCVLLASTAVPISAAALLLIGGQSALAIGLPLVALAPNTIFAFDRISNESLVLPLMAAITYALIAVAMNRSMRDFWLLGILTSIGIWTRLTIVSVLAGVLIAVLISRTRSWRCWLAALGLPIVALAILLAWNQAASGHMSGVIERTTVSATTIDDIEKALARLRGLPVARELVKNHLWSGGWAFLKPPDALYAAVVIGIAALIVIALVRRKKPISRAIWPLLAVIVAYLAAMAMHMVNGAIAAIKDPKFPTIGAEGWYLDEMRTIEACLVAVVVGVAFSARRVAQIFVILLLIANVAGTLLLLLPHWAGYSGHEIGFDVYRGAIEAAPIHRFPALPLAIAIGWLLALLGALKFADEPRPIRVG
jgi:hypothetical protein